MGVTERANNIPPFIAMDVLERAGELVAQGKDVIHLEVGEPDFDTPAPIVEAAKRALDAGHTHYTHSCGVMDLRQAVSQWYGRHYNVDVDPKRVLVTAGTSPAMLFAFNALLEAGQEVIISDPGYACYGNFIDFVGGKPAPVTVREEDAYQFKPEDIAAAMGPATKAILINSPANPTGQLLSAERIKAIAELAPGKPGGPYVMSDEIYHGLVYDGEKDHTILEFTDNAFVFNGFSKLFAMTGWRLGYVIAPPHFVRPMQKMHQNFAICAPSMAQIAGIAALTECDSHVADMVAKYDARRRVMIDGLKEIGLPVKHEPKGAFYVLTRCDHVDPDDFKLAFDILENALVGVTPGRDFGENGKGHLRFSYCNSLENIKEGIRRLGEYLSAKK